MNSISILLLGLMMTACVQTSDRAPGPDAPGPLPETSPGWPLDPDEDALRERYVSPTGRDDADGSQASPWRTLQHAADQAQPGDIIFVGPGTYAPEVMVSNSGTADHSIRFVADGAATLTLVDGQSGFHVMGSHLGFFGFDFNGLGTAFRIGDEFEIINDVCADVDGYAAALPMSIRAEEHAYLQGQCGSQPATNHQVRRVRIDGSRRDGSTAAITIEPGEFVFGVQITDEAREIGIANYEMSGMAHGVYADFEEVLRVLDGLLMEDLYIHDTTLYGARIVGRRHVVATPSPTGDTWQYVEGGAARRVAVAPSPRRTMHVSNLTMRRVRFDHCGFTEPRGEGYGNVLLQGIDNGLVEDSVFHDGRFWGMDSLICNDFLYRNNIFSISAEVGGLPTWSETGWGTAGLEVNGGTGNQVYNNLFVGFETGLAETLFPEDYYVTEVSLDVRNNLFVDNIASIGRWPHQSWLNSEEMQPNGVTIYVPVSTFTVDRSETTNMMDAGVNIEADGTQYLGDDPEFFGAGNVLDETLEPRFEDTTSYRLEADSPAVDAGEVLSLVPRDRDGVSRPRGAAPDIGPYER